MVSAALSPKQPHHVKDALEKRLQGDTQPGTESNSKLKYSRAATTFQLSKLTASDLKALFSGAPHFLLEKGRRDRWFPEVIFPWDEHDPLIQHLWDRKPLPHASFTLSTLHAHLPVPDGWAPNDESDMYPVGFRMTDRPKRATFDLGEFEVPNMLAMNGQEPGSIGFRHFLELPVSDQIKYGGPEQPRPAADHQRLSSLPATELYEMMERSNHPYSQCRGRILLDRKALLCEGPQAWKRIGVRDISFKALVERLKYLKQMRDDILSSREIHNSPCKDKDTLRELHDVLFTKFLFPPTKDMDRVHGDPHNLKSQIAVLAEVLSTPGAWFNFSNPKWRLRVGQILWETAPHPDGDCLDFGEKDDTQRHSWIRRGLERKWLLIQMLLAAELLVRLDAVVGIGSPQDQQGSSVSMEDIRHFDNWRNGKLEWDIIAVRRFLGNLNIAYAPSHPQRPPPQAGTGEQRHRFPLFGSSSNKPSDLTVSESWSAWDCTLVPSRVERQLDGLFTFAERLGWPAVDELKTRMAAKVLTEEPDSTLNKIYGSPVHNGRPERLGRRESRSARHLKGATALADEFVALHLSPTPNEAVHAADIGGWISRSWMSGFVLPGESLNHLLMGTLLENDRRALSEVGAVADFHGGFVYSGRSWWNKACIVGRVLACLEGSKACMGWVSVPILPRHAQSLKALQSTWLRVPVERVAPRSSKPRIKHGDKVSRQSTPLGEGRVTADDFTLPIDRPPNDSDGLGVNFDSLVLAFDQENQIPPEGKAVRTATGAFISFTLTLGPNESPVPITFALRFDVQFISSHECRPPLGIAAYHCGLFPCRSPSSMSHKAGRRARLPGHPLHNSFRYKYVPLEALPTLTVAQEAVSKTSQEVMVLDARKSSTKEALARAWCASVGCDAIISRVGRTCLSCSVREARAVEAAVVIRVGD